MVYTDTIPKGKLPEHRDIIIFKYKSVEYMYEVRENYLNILRMTKRENDKIITKLIYNNRRIFHVLKISNTLSFAAQCYSDISRLSDVTGSFPEYTNMLDCKSIINRLFEMCKKDSLLIAHSEMKEL